MERMQALLQRLQDQVALKATPSSLLSTVHQMEALLQAMLTEQLKTISPTKVAVVLPVKPSVIMAEPVAEAGESRSDEMALVEKEAHVEAPQAPINFTTPPAASENIEVFDLPFEEDDLTEAEANLMVDEKGEIVSEVVEPAILELNDQLAPISASVHEQLQADTPKMALADVLTEAPIKDLRKAFGVNDKYCFVQELFRGDEAMFDRSIKTINGFSIYPEAAYWMQRELVVKLGWAEKAPLVQQFYQMVKRRFA